MPSINIIEPGEMLAATMQVSVDFYPRRLSDEDLWGLDFRAKRNAASPSVEPFARWIIEFCGRELASRASERAGQPIEHVPHIDVSHWTDLQLAGAFLTCVLDLQSPLSPEWRRFILVLSEVFAAQQHFRAQLREDEARGKRA
jgi:hypothetical protein